jgi:hypothetical protein
MNEWLQQTWERSKHPFVRTGVLFLIVFFAVLGLASMISDTGFAQEVQERRTLVWTGAAGIALVIAVGWLYYRNHRELTDSRNLIDQLRDEISDLENKSDRLVQERESAFRLMKSYRTQTQESVIDELQRLALFGIMQEQWRKTGAPIERLRVEETTPDSAASVYSVIEECIVVIVNLGKQDKVVEGMKFIVQDPTDSHEYGMIEVREVHPDGAICTLLEIADMAFWGDAVQAAQEGRPAILDTSVNVIVPASALKEIPQESAEQLLVWLQNIRRAELL